MGLDCTPTGPVITPREVKDLEDRIELVRQGLWVLSNIAAMYDVVNKIQNEEEGMEEDECFLKDGTVIQVVDIMSVALKHNQQPLVIEGGYFLATLATTVTTRQLATYLFRTELVIIYIKLLEKKSAPLKLLMFTVEALHCLFECDRQHFIPESGNQSLISFFEA